MWVQFGSLLMAFAVILGAFGAHGLKHRLTPEMMEIYKTAVLYHMVHALGLFVVAWRYSVDAGPKAQIAGLLFTLGILIFSGSLYALSISGIRWLGAITPIGGLCFIAGWFFLAWKS